MYARLTSLRNQHGTLEHLIRKELRHPYPNAEHIRSLKKFKLRVRDEIRRIEQSLRQTQPAA